MNMTQVDGEPFVENLNVKEVVFVNIESFAAGTKLWKWRSRDAKVRVCVSLGRPSSIACFSFLLSSVGHLSK